MEGCILPANDNNNISVFRDPGLISQVFLPQAPSLSQIILSHTCHPASTTQHSNHSHLPITNKPLPQPIPSLYEAHTLTSYPNPQKVAPCNLAPRPLASNKPPIRSRKSQTNLSINQKTDHHIAMCSSVESDAEGQGI